VPLDASVGEVMNPHPTTAAPGGSAEEMSRLMHSSQIRHLPLIEDSGRLVGLALLDEMDDAARPARPNAAVIMAGGLGMRLRPLTEDTPKPMLKVGNKPLLETIIETLVEHRIHDIFLSINYKADTVRRYFGDGSQWGAAIRYIEEDERMGTAGALGLIDPRPDTPLLVVNGDVLTKIHFGSLLDYHHDKGAQATMCVREYDFQVPFGVVRMEGDRIADIDEKPVQRFFVNAGMYVLDPAVLDLVPESGRFDMTELFNFAIKADFHATVFPIREYWLDVGRIDDFQRANNEFPENFGP
jgi:NDP-sugar pyrophosphorylase family protein